jgi:hypothetical protein
MHFSPMGVGQTLGFGQLFPFLLMEGCVVCSLLYAQAECSGQRVLEAGSCGNM